MFWRSGGKTAGDSVNDLIARKQFGKAIEMLRAQLKGDSGNVFLRQQFAEVLAQSGQNAEAVHILDKLADEFANAGFAAKSIAVLKKIQRIDSSRVSVDEKLATLVDTREQEVRRRTSRRQYRVAAEREIASTPAVEAEPAPAAPPRRPAPPPLAQPRVPEARAEVEIEIENDAPAAADEVFEGEDANVQRAEVVHTPLFGDFSRDELVDVIRGLRLITFEPGDIIVAEGESGESLFVLTTGVVKAWVKNAGGHYGKVRVLTDGDFFGEISVLNGGKRTATITASSACELLELDKKTLEGIIGKHPRVAEIMQHFAEMRQNSTLESIMRGTTIR